MNKERTDGAAKIIAGNGLDDTGKLVVSKPRPVKGLSRHVPRATQAGVGDAAKFLEKFDKA